MQHVSGSSLQRTDGRRGRTPHGLGPLRILVLEDDPDVRTLWVDDLHDAGYTVLGVACGEDALTAVVDFDPALILTDVVMPGMDGFDFLARLRDRQAAAHIPVLFVSALAEGVRQTLQDDFATREFGIVGILSKPVHRKTLIARVRHIIADAHAARSAVTARQRAS